MWEFATLQHYFHPSVQKFVEKVCSLEKVEYAGDPFEVCILKVLIYISILLDIL